MYVVYIQRAYSVEVFIIRGIILLHKFKLRMFLSCEKNVGQDHKTKTSNKSFTNSAYFKYVWTTIFRD
jgi:hypothetical protein